MPSGYKALQQARSARQAIVHAHDRSTATAVTRRPHDGLAGIEQAEHVLLQRCRDGQPGGKVEVWRDAEKPHSCSELPTLSAPPRVAATRALAVPGLAPTRVARGVK